MSITVNVRTARPLLVQAIKARLVPLLAGPPGTGKSDLIRDIAEEFGLKVIDVRLAQVDPTELNGFPSLVDGRGRYLPMDTFPIEGDEIPEGYNGWLIFFDEITSAPQSVQAAAYKILLDRLVGNIPLHPNVAMVGAGNLEKDNAVVEPMSTALQSRMVHLELTADHEVWLEWAETHGLDWRVTSFIRHRPDLLHQFDPDHEDKTFACPRTWSFVSRLIADVKEIGHDLLPLLAGTIGEGVAREFYGYLKVFGELPHYGDVVTSPSSAALPSEPSSQYAVTGMIASNATEKDLDAIMRYVERLPAEFQVICAQGLFRRNSKFLSVPAMQSWVAKVGDEMF